MAALTDDGQRIIAGQVHIHPRRRGQTEPPPTTTGTEAVDVEYEIPQTIEAVRKHNAKRVALQFPDSLLTASVAVCQRLQQSLEGVIVCVLADTSFSSCCADVVAARHMDADLIVHYGPACLTPTVGLPVHYVLERLPLKITPCVEALSAFVQARKGQCKGVVLAASAEYRHALPDVYQGWSQGHPEASEDVIMATGEVTDGSAGDSVAILGLSLSPGHQLTDYAVFFLGDIDSPNATPLLALCRAWPEWPLHMHTDNVDGSATSEHEEWVGRRLKRRHFIIEKVKESSVIGVVVATLSVAGQREAVSALRRLITATGKRCYVILVGRINVPKLANFDQIDLFTVVACPSATLIDYREFPVPVVTPLEVVAGLQALLGAESGSALAQWDMDLRRFLHTASALEGADHQPLPADISLISGSVVHGCTDEDVPLSTAVATVDPMQVQKSSMGIQRLKQRTFQGLDPTVEGIDTAIQGQHGIARGYSGEPQE